MLVFWKEALVVFAVPKTGTQALYGELGDIADIAYRNPPELKHMTVAKFDRWLYPTLKRNGLGDLTSVAVMREPRDWLGSWFRYRSRPALDGRAVSTKGLSFDDFVRAYLSPDPPPFAALGTQARFLCGDGEAPQVSRVFRYDALPAFYGFLSERLGRPVSPARVNVSPERSLTLAPSLTRRLQEKCQKDFEIWEALSGAPA